jgi:hypothetical protein
MIGEHSPVPSEPRRARWRSAGLVQGVFPNVSLAKMEVAWAVRAQRSSHRPRRGAAAFLGNIA